MDYHRLGLGTASSLVRAVRLADWGAHVLVECIYDPLGERKNYQLSFLGCSQLALAMVPAAAVQEPDAELIGISLGQDGGRQPAILTTDLFEMHITYQQFQCLKGRQPSGSALSAFPAPTAGMDRSPLG
jgi:hypothetical protein